MIVSEGLFSMDGDGPDLQRLIAIKERFSAWLMMDDAHGLGVLGTRGRASSSIRTCARRCRPLARHALKIAGQLWRLCRRQRCRDRYLKHLAPGFVYSVGMPATAATALTQGARDHAAGARAVERLQAQSRRFHAGATAAGLDTGGSWGLGIVPIVIGDTVATLKLAERLLRSGINAFPHLAAGCAGEDFEAEVLHQRGSQRRADRPGREHVGAGDAELGDTSLKALLPSDG